ncbi:DUF4232 domain-containing protein [Streptomyces sp. MI02-7b]|uniref:DUF4232 domain-containing protein n=1 Tax=Streptomyces sp. MI02-7b TaxID=462941 RepID=UPI0029A1D9EB|nr:DUF4232 domain-containing protein [Streptomyces sp. MI02-7b]MDX3071002.1 DUF4232 domain-containing protein [Streptomyces sp. MI02-7b]
MANQHHDVSPAQHHRGRPALPGRRARRVGVPVLLGAALATAILTGCGKGGGSGNVSAPQTLPGSASPASGDATDSAPADTSSAAAPGTTTSTATGPTGTTGTTGTTATANGGSGGTGATAAGTGRCHTADLRASIGPNDPGAGQENFPVVLTNRSSRTCTVYGFPGLAFVNGAGQQVTVDPERNTGLPKQRVTLAPGASAWSPMSFSNPDITGVTTVVPAAVLVTPPDERTSLRVPWNGGKVSNTGKASVPRLGPLQAGTGA